MDLPESIVLLGSIITGMASVVIIILKAMSKKPTPVSYNGNEKIDLKFKMIEQNLNEAINTTLKLESKTDELGDQSIHYKKDIEHLLYEIKLIRTDFKTLQISMEKQISNLIAKGGN